MWPPSVSKIMKMREDVLESKTKVDDFKKKLKINKFRIPDQNTYRLKAQPAQIKSRIESLIERGYMKRDEKDLGVFIYLPYRI